MTKQRLMELIGRTLPDATLGEDNDGQIIIFTDMCVMTNGELKSFSAVQKSMEAVGCSMKVQGNPD